MLCVGMQTVVVNETQYGFPRRTVGTRSNNRLKAKGTRLKVKVKNKQPTPRSQALRGNVRFVLLLTLTFHLLPIF